jgi:hypothetical protein
MRPAIEGAYSFIRFGFVDKGRPDYGARRGEAKGMPTNSERINECSAGWTVRPLSRGLATEGVDPFIRLGFVDKG